MRKKNFAIFGLVFTLVLAASALALALAFSFTGEQRDPASESAEPTHAAPYQVELGAEISPLSCTGHEAGSAGSPTAPAEEKQKEKVEEKQKEKAEEKQEEKQGEKIFRENATVYDTGIENGTLWKLGDCLVFFPNRIDEDTQYLVHFAGSYSGWILRPDHVKTFLREYRPNAVMIFFSASYCDGRRTLADRIETIWTQIQDNYDIHPDHIAISGSSNGGYSALYAAAFLMRDYGVRTDKVLILDMGNLWGFEELLITKEEAQPLIETGTKVYAFSKRNNIYRTASSRKWLGYGVETYEVACVHWDHERITSMALRNGTLSWAIGERDALDSEIYEIIPASPDNIPSKS